MALTDTSDANYFELTKQPKIPTEFALKVKKQIDKAVGYVFSFSIYAMHNSQYPDKVIKINVTERNEFPPVFDQEEYRFLALRNGFNESLVDIGAVHASDADKQVYNNVFQYYIMDATGSRYVFVDPNTGDLELIDDFPPDVSNVTFNVTAIDAGSPQRLNTARVIVDITDLKRKSKFTFTREYH